LDLNQLTTNEHAHFDSYKRALSETKTTKAYVDKDGVEHTPNGEIHTGDKNHESGHDPIALDCTLFLFLMMAIGQFCK
jgi:hypothetical protein